MCIQDTLYILHFAPANILPIVKINENGCSLHSSFKFPVCLKFHNKKVKENVLHMNQILKHITNSLIL